MQQAGRPAADIAADVRAGRVSAVDVVAEHLARIAAVDPRIGAFLVVRGERALADAADVDRRPDRSTLPLAGVPVAVKDNVAVAGEPMRAGSAATTDAPQPADHPVVARLRAAGAVVVGTTQMPELAIWPFTDGPLGTTRNPWAPDRTAGGSSGGSAAAVAAALAPLAVGNDALGSIRIPAAACGVVGLKPGLGLLPGTVGRDGWTRMSENGPLATTVADVALGLAVMAADPALADVARPDSAVRVALDVTPPAPGTRADPAWVAAARTAAGLLAARGHRIGEHRIAVPVWAMRAVFARWFAGADDDAVALGLDRRTLQRRTRAHARLGRWSRRLGWVRPADTERWRSALAGFVAEHDVLLTPALAAPPPALGPWAGRGWAANSWAAARYTGALQSPWNLAGWPSIAVPAGRHPDGTPLAVQLTEPPGREALLLALAADLERAAPWQRHAPLGA